MSEIAVRLAGVGDAEVVIDLVGRLLVELGGEALEASQEVEASRAVYGRVIVGEGGFVALGEVGGVASAVCTVSMQEALRTSGRYAIVQEMFVAPEMRSSGIGAEVMRFVLAHASEAGCEVVELGTPLDGERAVAFYEGLGFRPVGGRLRWTAR